MSHTIAICNLKSFASYIATGHLASAATKYTQLLHDERLCLPELYLQMPETAWQAKCHNNLKILLYSLSGNQSFKAIEEYFYLWYPGHLENSCLYKITTDEILLFFHLHKQLLLHYLAQYTDKVSEAVSITSDLENIFIKAGRKILHVHEKRQQDSLVKN